MRIGIHVGHWEGDPHDVAALAVEAERAGLDSVWTSETWGSDAAVLLAWIAARTERIGLGAGVLQIPGRTPAAAAMTALTLDHLSGGRMRLGLGVSGPQVAEGWHGAPFDRPLERTREYVAIVRSVLHREAPVTAPGPGYPLPLPAGPGKALKANVRPLRSDLPVYLAAMGPRNVALAAEIADGWIPFLYSPDRAHAFDDVLREGAGRGGRDLATLDVAPMVPVAIGDDVVSCRDRLRPLLALYAGGMGSAGANFYKDLITRYGFGEAAAAIQRSYLAGRRAEAAALVPDAMVDELCLVGPVERVRDRLDAWRAAGVTTLLAKARDVLTIRALAEAAS
ncbi:MAG TPA: LLM class F420-dependent oxidoreductase [Actinomycetota bacterium]|nr:LLM class F420-dependent oxidoreductase [Actinomycetota bacterium]